MMKSLNEIYQSERSKTNCRYCGSRTWHSIKRGNMADCKKFSAFCTSCRVEGHNRKNCKNFGPKKRHVKNREEYEEHFMMIEADMEDG